MLSTKEASERTNGSLQPEELARLAKRGKIPGAVKTANGKWLIPEEAVATYMQAQSKQNKSLAGRIWSWWEKTSRVPLILITILVLSTLANSIDFFININSMTDIVMPGWSLYVNKARSNEILIIVTQFNGSGDYDPSIWIHDEIQEIVKSDKAENVRVEKIPLKPQDKEEAIAIGERYRASMVIWGSFDNAAIISYLEITRKNEMFRDLPVREPIINIDPKEFNLYIVKQIPSEMRYLALVTLAQIYQHQFKYELSIDVLSKALSINLSPSFRNINIEPLLLLRAIAYLRTNQVDLSIADYEKIISVNPDSFEAQLNIGSAFYTKRKYQEAASHSLECIRIDPDYAMVYSNLGVSYYRLKNYKKASEAFDKALSLLKSDEISDRTTVLINYCALLDDSEEYTKGKTICEEGIEMAPDDNTVFHNYGYLELDAGDNERALSLFDRSIQLGSTDPRTFQGRGVAYRNLGNFELALADFETTITMDPNYGGGYYERGVIRYMQRDYKNALSDFNKTVEIWADNEPAYRYRGLTYIYLDDFDNAITDLSKATGLNPENADNYIFLATAFVYKGEFLAAKSNYVKAYSINKDLVIALIGKASVEIKLTEYDAAIADADKVIQLNPYLAQAYFVKAEAHFVKQEYSLASKVCYELGNIDRAKIVADKIIGCKITTDQQGNYILLGITKELPSPFATPESKQ